MRKADIKLKPCPFCGKHPDMEDGDTIYPSGTFWRQQEDYRVYVGTKEREEGDQACWNITCPEVAGGCGAVMEGDSIEETNEKWNRRAI